MMHHLKFTLVALLLLASSFTIYARDLDKSDPVRKEILDAAREDTNEKFIVKYMLHEGNLAYLCAFKTDQSGAIFATDDQYEVYEYLLIKQEGHWISRPTPGGFTENYKESDCIPDTADFSRMMADNLSADAKAMQSMWIDYLLHALREQVDLHKWSPEDQAAYAALRAQGMLKTFPVDIAGKDMFHPKLKYDLQKQNICKTNRACITNAEASLAQMQKFSTSNTVSELVWYSCDNSLLRDDKIEHLQQCVTNFQAKPYCRTGMDYFNDHADVARCFNEIMRAPVGK